MQDQFLRIRPRDVALRKESVDRNRTFRLPRSATVVALRKESVDRNHQPTGISEMGLPSLSARRAWIEIDGVVSGSGDYVSLSARRAWIEISYGALDGASEIVALRKESVDRNPRVVTAFRGSVGRSPQGERG